MQPPVYDAFWSYAHADDERTNGKVLALAESIKDEFELMSGIDINIFVDRNELKWGDLWRERIESALGEIPFFIPVISPRFLKSAECRKEFLSFSGVAKSRGAEKLLLPILFVPVPDLKEESEDEIIAAVARSQYIDWTDFRLRSADDPDVLRALNELAERLQLLQAEVAGTTRATELRTDVENAENIADLVKAINERLQGWMSSVEFDSLASRHWNAFIDERVERIRRFSRTPGKAGAILSLYHKLGLEILPIAEQRVEAAAQYAKLSVELDPLVATAVRWVATHPEMVELLDPLREGVSEAYENMSRHERDHTYASLQGASKYSQHAQLAGQQMARSMVYVADANEIVLGWRNMLELLDKGELSDVAAAAVRTDEQL